jgi:hypothetical protein
MRHIIAIEKWQSTEEQLAFSHNEHYFIENTLNYHDL